MSISNIIEEERSFERRRSCAIGCLGLIGVSLIGIVSCSVYFCYVRDFGKEYRSE